MMHIGQGWQDISEQFEQQADSSNKKRLKKWKNRLLAEDQVINSIDERNFEDKKTYHARFTLRGTLIGAFEYSSEFSKATSWTLEGVMPLRDYDGGPADILICNSEDHGTIAVLALVQKEDSQTVLQRCKKISDHLENNTSAIEDDLSTRINEAEMAVAVSELSPDTVVNDWETNVDSLTDEKISIWRFETEASERLSVVEQFSTVDWDAHIPPGKLGDELQSGIEIAERPHISIEFFLDSHPRTILVNLAKILFKKHRGTDTTNSYFSKSELVEELKLVAESEVTKQESSDRAEELIDWWEFIGIVGDAANPDTYGDDEDVYSIDVRLSHLSTAIGSLHSQHKECMRDAIVELDLMESMISK